MCALVALLNVVKSVLESEFLWEVKSLFLGYVNEYRSQAFSPKAKSPRITKSATRVFFTVHLRLPC